jgi:hypothetical protein
VQLPVSRRSASAHDPERPPTASILCDTDALRAEGWVLIRYSAQLDCGRQLLATWCIP